MSLRVSLHAAAAIAMLSLSGCASIISGRHADVAINSAPANAHVTVRNQEGQTVAEATTPAVVSLKRGAGFFKRANYVATIEKPGYQTADIPIRSKLNPWIAGNLVFGGVTGLVVDPYTGAMWKPNPAQIHQNLYPLNQPDVAPVDYQTMNPGEPNLIQ
jgi:hypothetical protein